MLLKQLEKNIYCTPNKLLMLKKTTLISCLTLCSLLSVLNVNATSLVKSSDNSIYFKISEFNFNISPNPAQDFIELEFTEPINANLFIHDSLGNKVIKLEITNEINKTVSLNRLNSGIYFICVKTDDKTVIKRFIKY